MKFLLILPFFYLLAAAETPQKVVFTAHISDGGNIYIGNINPIPFNEVTADVDNGYDTTTGVFTSPRVRRLSSHPQCHGLKQLLKQSHTTGHLNVTHSCYAERCAGLQSSLHGPSFLLCHAAAQCWKHCG